MPFFSKLSVGLSGLIYWMAVWVTVMLWPEIGFIVFSGASGPCL
ncbi:hypothetical protein [Pseudomonas fluorescens]|nr:hypothetical protein [Pseudomonas fluorescens]